MGNSGELAAVNILVEGKTDTELLNAICAALSDNNEDLIVKLMDATNYNQRTATNVQLAAAIVTAVLKRKQQEDIKPGDWLKDTRDVEGHT